MKRTFKFRAWSTTNKKMYYRVLVGNTETDSPCSAVWDGTWKEFDKHCGVIQQFTGVKDINNTEVYEGDIVRVKRFEIINGDTIETEEVDGEIFWCNIDNLFLINYNHIRPDDVDHMFSNKKIQVIGNIFETPELLK